VKLTLLPQAQAELDEAFDWYEAQVAGLGLRFVAEVRAVFTLIEKFPQAWHPLSRNTRRLKWTPVSRQFFS
jgi:hypothetical protein